MRYYKLKIGMPIVDGVSFESINVLSLSSVTTSTGFLGTKSVHPTPLQIEFNVRSFTDVEASIPATIKIHNLPKSVYKALAGWAQERPPVTLEAGWNSEYVMSKALGYKDIKNQIILTGNLQNVFGNFVALDNYVILTTALAVPMSEMREYIAKQSGNQVTEIQAQFEAGKSIKDKVVEYVKLVIASGWKIALSEGLKSFVNNNRNAILFSFSNFNSLMTQLAFNLAVGFAIDASQSIIRLFIDAKNEKIPKDQKEKYKNDWLENSDPIEVTAADLIVMPEVLGYSNHLSVVTRMRPDIKLGSIIKIGKSITSLSGGLADNPTFTDEGIEDLNIINQGEYVVISVNHTGNFYGKTADSWSTHMLVQPRT